MGHTGSVPGLPSCECGERFIVKLEDIPGDAPFVGPGPVYAYSEATGAFLDIRWMEAGYTPPPAIQPALPAPAIAVTKLAVGTTTPIEPLKVKTPAQRLFGG